MGTKLTKEQKRKKQKKERARQEQQRKEFGSKAYKKASNITELLIGTRFGEFDPATFAMALNESSPNRSECNGIATLRQNEVVKDIEKRTCRLVAAHTHGFTNETMSLPLVGRIYSIFEDEWHPYIASYPQELTGCQRLQIEEVAKNELKATDDESCMGIVYFTGIYLMNGACHFAAVVNRALDFEIYVVTQKKWVLLQDSSQMFPLYSISDVSIAHALDLNEHYSQSGEAIFSAQSIEDGLEGDSETAGTLRKIIQLAGTDAINESEIVFDSLRSLHKRELIEATQKCAELSSGEIQRLSREIDHLRSRLTASETRIENQSKSAKQYQADRSKIIQVPIEEKFSAFFRDTTQA
jgi:hypothetical protein